MKINNTEQLVEYLASNFDSLSTESYLKIINTTMRIYPFYKPCSVMDAIDMIKHYSLIPLDARPLFPDIKTFDQ